jgi:hypothetical protein
MSKGKGETLMNTLKRYPLLVFYTVALLFAGIWEELYVLYGAGNPIFSVLTLFLASYGPTVATLRHKMRTPYVPTVHVCPSC